MTVSTYTLNWFHLPPTVPCACEKWPVSVWEGNVCLLDVVSPNEEQKERVMDVFVEAYERGYPHTLEEKWQEAKRDALAQALTGCGRPSLPRKI